MLAPLALPVHSYGIDGTCTTHLQRFRRFSEKCEIRSAFHCKNGNAKWTHPPASLNQLHSEARTVFCLLLLA